MEPTEKQLKFIEDICDELDIDNPHCSTKQEASEWIHDHIDEFHKSLRQTDDWDEEPDWSPTLGELLSGNY